MNPDWQNFLTQINADIDDGIVKSFGNLSAELDATAHGIILCDLSQFCTLRISGEDAQSFLQNLLSNDIQETASHRAQFSSFNSAKGRMLASMLIWRIGEEYLIQLPRELCEPMRKKLGMYILRSKVRIADASNEIISLGISGSAEQDILHKQFGAVPQRTLEIASFPNASCIKFDDNRFQINTTLQEAPALWNSLSRQARPVGSICWDWLNIRSGIPTILPQTQEQFVAQMTNFDLIGGVSFKKGCYPGQEIVARTQYLGKLKRRMYLAHMDPSASGGKDIPQAGDELFSADMEGQASGMLVNVAPSPEGGFDALAVVQMNSQETQTVHWKSLQGAPLQFLTLPYSLQ